MTDANVQRLLHAASKAPTQQESARLVAEAEQIQATARNAAAMDRELDLANAVIADHLTPVAVHEHHTATTDWIGALDTSGGENVADEVTAQASLWYGRTAAIKPFREEWEEQARGIAHRLAGSFGEQAAVAEDVFLTHVGTLYQRELDAGLFTLANSGLPQVGEPGNDPDLMGLQGPSEPSGLPGEATSSERAPIMQAMENGAPGIHDQSMPNTAEADNTGPDRTAGRKQAVDSEQQRDQAGQRAGLGEDATLEQHHQLGYQHGAENVRRDDTYDSYQESPDTPDGAYGRGYAAGGVDRASDTRRNHRNVRYEGAARTGAWADDFGEKFFNPPAEQAIPETTGPHRLLSDEHDPDALGPRGNPDAGVHWRAGDTVHVIRHFGPDQGGKTWAEVRNPHDHGGASYLTPSNLQKITRKDTSMQTAACPSCRGRGRVAVRVQGASGLDQVDQVVDPNNQPKQTPYPTDVAFPWEMQQDSSAQIQEAEGQIAQREQLKGASLEQRARYIARQAYLRALGGQDDSGWLGDMGAGGVTPGEQDGGNPGSADNISQPDPVYGFGGDQGDRGGLKPYGADEADDYTNNPGMNWQPGQPSQMDMGGRGNTVGQPTMANRRPSINDDPQLRQALAYARRRREFLANQGWS